MNKTVIKLLSLTLFIGITFFMINANKNESLRNVSDLYEIKAVKIPHHLELAGEVVPLEDPNIRERIDRELLVNTYWQSNGLLLIKRANKFFPIIEPLLKKYGLHDDFKYLCVAESGLINVPSPARAAGFWHFLPKTAREYGLEVNNNVDERYNIDKSTRAAADYLKQSKEKLGSWTLAAAAYNAGNSRIANRMEEQQVSNYYDLYLNRETSRYVFRILALKEIMSNPKKYGFIYDQEDLYTYPRVKEIMVNYEIPNLSDFAKEHNITYKELKLVNPWLRETKLNNKSGKEYFIKIPIK
ncbi:MAG: lytic transglycosylase domain-containing protein [Tenacibaculum sp.]|nr:lytic transglycosylase domain-containing protein [Tenacibaculum sp.]